MLSQSDRIAFSLNIVSAPGAIANFASAKVAVMSQVTALQSLDSANSNLFAPVNDKINAYQGEFSYLDSNGRTIFTEQDIQNSGNKIINNYFFPNNTSVTVPSLSATNNVWTKPTPYALTYAIGKNVSEAYNAITGEASLTSSILAAISLAATHQDIENTSGQNATQGNPGTLPPVPDSIQSFPAVVAIKNNLASLVNSYLALLIAEKASIVTNDSNVAIQAQNSAAISAISTIQSALNIWSAYVDFQTPPVSTYAAFYAYSSSLLAPTKLYSSQLAALQSAVNARLATNASRIAQLNVILGTVSQDISTGVASGSGLYFKRYSFLSLRLNSLGGSLSQYLALSGTTNAQTAAAANIASTAATYQSILSTTKFSAPANGTAVFGVMDSSQFAIGDTVFLYAEGQVELQRSVKSINGNSMTLNDVVPSKYTPASNARMYKDLN